MTKTENRLDQKVEEFLEMPIEDLKDYHDAWYPGGSGPIGAMYDITSLIRVVATLRGFDVSSWVRNK